MKKLAIGGDHAGFTYKEALKKYCTDLGHKVIDFGPDTEASVDYPDYIHPLSQAVTNGDADLGIAICGSGNGVCMTANKHANIRAALVWNNDLSALARAHNNANVICLPARFITLEEAKEFVQTFLNTSFEGGRHQRRVDKITK